MAIMQAMAQVQVLALMAIHVACGTNTNYQGNEPNRMTTGIAAGFDNNQ